MPKRFAIGCALFFMAATAWPAVEDSALEVGIAVRDVTPDQPIWLAGYASRDRPSERVDHPLLAQAMAFRDARGERFVTVSLDNCEVNESFNEPVIRELRERHGLPEGRVMIVSSHTHSAPVLDGPLDGMYFLEEENDARVAEYSRRLRRELVEVVGEALADLRLARLEYGRGRATFAMNRRVYREDGMAFGENPDGPVDWDVPVLRVNEPDGTPRAILFGYACHGTSIAGDDFYVVSGDYMAYAREHLEAVYPGMDALYLTGMGADSNPSPRGTLLDSKRHGLELAGAVAGVLDRPMRRVSGPLRVAYSRVSLPFHPPPSVEALREDASGENRYVCSRARKYLEMLESGEPLPESVNLPVAVVRFGDDLTWIAIGGEVVADYSIRFKREHQETPLWTIGYAYEVPCYIPTMRILKEGGYEADSSLIYYGFYGPFQGKAETLLVEEVDRLMDEVQSQK